MYLPILLSLSLYQVAQAGHPLGLGIQGDSCRIPEKEVLITLSSSLGERVHNLERCSHHQEHVRTSASGSPWTEPVKCMPKENSSTTYCVYTDSKFANGRGISLFTTPSIADNILNLPAFTAAKKYSYDKIHKSDDAPWEVRFIPGRGNGLFATRTLHRGDKIVVDTPVGVYMSDSLQPDSKIGYIYLHTAFMQLPKTTQDLFLGTMAGSQGDPIMERVNTNAFSGQFEGAAHFLLYPETALMNHDCRPNAMYHYDPKSLIHSTEALRTIEPGEEITIPYTDILSPRGERQKSLNTYWGFTCSCSLCSGSVRETEESDLRLERMKELQGHLADWNPWSEGTPAMAEELITLYEKEDLHGARAMGHTFAALAYNAVGNAKVAEWHADFAVDLGLVNSGTSDDAEQMKMLLMDPKAHWSHNARRGKE